MPPVKIVSFGRYKGRRLAEVPERYLLYMLTKRLPTAATTDFLDEIACRLMADFDGVLAALLAPPAPGEIAEALAKRAEKAVREQNRRLTMAARRLARPRP
ncbi:MAG: hypothetical protein BroJett006_09510 [Betaproteobacteria bacterium]|nr:MAG: hypothetical protein BroJett006_09510 [Betaproteobacteria bacterium]